MLRVTTCAGRLFIATISMCTKGLGWVRERGGLSNLWMVVRLWGELSNIDECLSGSIPTLRLQMICVLLARGDKV